MKIIDISAPESPNWVGEYDTPGYARGVAVSGGYAYIADGLRGLRVVNISDPENPVEVGYYDTPGEAFGVALSDDGLIYVTDSTNMGIYRFTDPADVGDNVIHQPSSFTLSPAYPNPFNALTTLSYSLPVPSDVKIGVCDVNGHLISTLVREHQTAGHHTVQWNPQSVPTSLYIVRMEAGAFNAVQKVVLAK